MPRADTNNSAISIQLALSADEAFSKLNEFGQKSQDLAEEVSSSAQKALGNIVQFTQDIAKQTEDIGKSFRSLNKTTNKLQIGFIKISKESVDQYNTNKKMLDGLREAEKIQKDEIKGQLKLKKELFLEQKINDEKIIHYEKLLAAIKTKNEGHIDENALVDKENSALDRAEDLLNKKNEKLKKSKNQWDAIATAVRTVWGLIKSGSEETEKFVTTNYRAYGSQEQLVAGARQLAIQNGITSEKAIEAYAVLGNLKTPREELDKYAQSLAEANRYLGVDIQTLGTFTQRMRGAGGDAAATDRQLRFMSEAMRKFGLNTQDVNKIVGDTAISSQELMIAFGGSQKAVEGFDKIKAVLMGVNKEMGQSTDVANKFMNNLAGSVIERAKFGQLAGMQIKNEEDLSRAMIKAGLAIRRQGIDVEGLRKAAEKGDKSAQLRLKTLAKVYTGGDQNALLMLGRVGELSEALNFQGDSAEELTKIHGKLEAEAMDPLSEANDTFARQLALLTDHLGTFYNMIVAVLQRALKPLLKGLNWLISAFISAKKAVDEFIAPLWDIPGIGIVLQILVEAAKYIGALVAVLGIATMSIGLFSLAFFGFDKFILRSLRIVRMFGRTLASLASSLGSAISSVLSSIGTGLQSLGKSIAPVIGPLLGLALAMVMVAASAWILAQAFVVISTLGKEAIGPIMGLVAAMIVLMAAIATIAYYAAPVTPIILALGAAVLMVGAAAFLMGYGLKLASEGIGQIVAFLPALDAGLTWGLIAKITALGAAAAIVAPELFVLGAAMILIAAATYIFALALVMIVESLQFISAEVIVAIAEGFKAAAYAFISAAFLVGVAAAAFMIAGPNLGIAAGILLTASIAILTAGIFLALGTILIQDAAIVLAVAANQLAAASDSIITSGANILTGGTLLLEGAWKLIEGATVLLGAGTILIGASLALKLGLYMFSGTAGKIQELGSLVSQGGMSMWLGALAIGSAAYILRNSISDLTNVGEMLISTGITVAIGVGIVITAAGGLMIGALVLSRAALLLIPAAFAIWLGMRSLDAAVSRFSGSIEKTQQISMAVFMLGQAFAQLAHVPLNGIRELADNALDAVPGLNKLGSSLQSAAKDLDGGVKAFRDPADELMGILDRLSTAIISFGEGFDLANDVGQMADKLEKYATLLEGVSQRIEAAVYARAVPAMRSAEEAGIEEAVRSEAITTVQVMDKTEGETRDSSEELDLVRKQLVVLNKIDERLAAIQPGKTGELAEIADLLRTHLPNMGKSSGGLGSEFNAWAK